jgi:hypothetical protein
MELRHGETNARVRAPPQDLTPTPVGAQAIAEPPPPKPPSRNRFVYTPELIAHARHLYEHTSTSLAKIAVDLGVHRSTVDRLGNHENWRRYMPPPRDVPATMRLLAEAEALEAGVLSNDNDATAAATAPPHPDDGSDPPPTARDIIDRLYRTVVDELATVQAMRAQLGRHPRGAVEAERTARTLWSLTETFQKLQRLQCALPENDPNNDDDMPTDIDEFRNELARRIRIFVQSRTERSDGDGVGAQPLDPAR